MMSSRAVVAGDLGRPGLEVDVGDAAKRGQPAAGGRHPQVLAASAGRCGRSSGRRTRIGMRRSPMSSLATLASMSPTVAIAGDLGDGVGADAEPRGVVGPRPDDDLRRGRRGGRPRIGQGAQRRRISRCSSSAAPSQALAGVAGRAGSAPSSRRSPGAGEGHPGVGDGVQLGAEAVADLRHLGAAVGLQHRDGDAAGHAGRGDRRPDRRRHRRPIGGEDVLGLGLLRRAGSVELADGLAGVVDGRAGRRVDVDLVVVRDCPPAAGPWAPRAIARNIERKKMSAAEDHREDAVVQRPFQRLDVDGRQRRRAAAAGFGFRK